MKKTMLMGLFMGAIVLAMISASVIPTVDAGRCNPQGTATGNPHGFQNPTGNPHDTDNDDGDDDTGNPHNRCDPDNPPGNGNDDDGEDDDDGDGGQDQLP